VKLGPLSSCGAKLVEKAFSSTAFVTCPSSTAEMRERRVAVRELCSQN